LKKKNEPISKAMVLDLLQVKVVLDVEANMGQPYYQVKVFAGRYGTILNEFS
jgi:hypothetical protein